MSESVDERIVLGILDVGTGEISADEHDEVVSVDLSWPDNDDYDEVGDTTAPQAASRGAYR